MAAILVGVPCVYIITERGGVFFLLLVDLMILLGLSEFFQLMEAKGNRPSRLLGYAAALAVSLHVYLDGPALTLVLTVILVLIMIREIFRRDADKALANIAVTVLGVMYVGWLGSHLVMLRELDVGYGSRIVFFGLLIIWACDTVAYIVGILFGRKKLVPHISPNKTWAGAVGGLAGGTLAGWVSTLTFLPVITPLTGAGLGLACAVIGQLGDLVESLLKRDAGIKDSAQIIPGHGGILDRVDSLLFSMPLLFYWFRFMVL
ncbi:phosphatidate cytidylyltransferase [bacterium]|nr:phosphatidate cytidylyltransferase [bacterium]